MGYSLGVRALSEFIGMAMVIYSGEAALANELLPNTKGHGMGWGWTVFTFGYAFLIPLQIFTQVSAKLNPAMCLAQWVWGHITGVDFVVLSLAELAGAMFGALLHWLHYLPHYKTVPEPPALDREDNMLRRRDAMRESALQIASYNTRQDRVVDGPKVDRALSDIVYYFDGKHVSGEHTTHEVLNDYFMHSDPITRRNNSLSGGGAASAKSLNNPLERRTLQVADLHNHLAKMHVQGVVRRRACPTCQTDDDTSSTDCQDAPLRTNSSPAAQKADGAVSIKIDGPPAPSPPSPPPPAAPKPKGVRFSALDAEQKKALALYQAALVADQNAKLSIFATRPAIHSPLFNLLTEGMGTVMLLLTALLIELQPRHMPLEQRKIFEVCLQPFLICTCIVVLISGLGGPTAYAANPARDLGPRIMHFLLPIPNKGRSEWGYAWVPVLGPFIGGAIAGLLFIAIEELQFPGGGANGCSDCAFAGA